MEPVVQWGDWPTTLSWALILPLASILHSMQDGVLPLSRFLPFPAALLLSAFQPYLFSRGLSSHGLSLQLCSPHTSLCLGFSSFRISRGSLQCIQNE